MFGEVEQPDLQRPNIARVYDYMLGGNHNFAVDREFAARMEEQLPGIAAVYANNRAFLHRVVRFCAQQGIDQFLDLGSGIPTVGNVHETARATHPSARVAYVDREPVAVAHSEQVLDGRDGLSITAADLRDPAAVLTAPTVRAVLDLDRPVAVLMIAVLHFLGADEDPAGVVSTYRAALAPGSMVVISHGSADMSDPSDREVMVTGERLYRASSTPIHLRDRDEIAALMGGLPLVEPGLVELVDWRPDADGPPGRGICGGYGMVGRVGQGPVQPASTS